MMLFNTLGIPEQFQDCPKHSWCDPRGSKALDFYFAKMQENPIRKPSGRYRIKEAVEEFHEQVIQRLQEIEIERERRREERSGQKCEEDNSFVRDTATSAIGTWAGTRSLRKEVRKQTELQERAKKREQARYDEERRRRARQSQREWYAVKEANEKRRRNGQPELPYPPREWY